MEIAYKLYIGKSTFKYLFNYVFDGNNNIVSKYSNNCQYLYGEPVSVEGKRGFLVDLRKEEEENGDNIVNVKIKLKKGFYTGKINIEKIQKETYKKKGSINLDLLLNKDNKANTKSNNREVVCGSQICNIY